MVRAICSVIALKRGNARLAAVRVVSILVEWNTSALERLYVGGVTTGLVRILLCYYGIADKLYVVHYLTPS